MKESIILGIKGFIIGVANIIPGVSGGTLAITLGIYERIIDAISHFFKNIKENIKFLLPIGIGAVLSIIALSHVIGYSLEHYPFATTLFFIGLILGGMPLLMKKVKGKANVSNIILFLITFGIVLLFTFLKEGDKVVSLTNLTLGGYLVLFLVGAIASATMVIPGISGSFVLMLLGYYKPIINTIQSLSKFQNIGSNLLILIPFGLGVLTGIILIAKVIEYLLKKFEVPTYFGIIGFVLASIISIVVPMGLPSSVLECIIGVLLAILGFGIAYQLGEK